MYDLAIIGGGPAGVAAGVYAARKRLSTVFIAESVGGQSIDSQDIQNWIGTPHISGLGLQQALEKHLREYSGDILTLKLGERVEHVDKKDGSFVITTPKGSYEAKTLLLATGGTRKKLTVPGADAFEHKGLTYCASCDGPLFSGQDVAVVGGGNAGFESAAQLLAYAKSVTLISRSDFSRADAATVEQVSRHPNFTGLTDTMPITISGDTFVQSMTIKNSKTGEERTLPVAGIFVEIGMDANTGFIKDVVELNQYGRIVVDPKTQRAGKADDTFCGVWAAGDCTDGLYHQNNIAAGDAVKALEDIYYYIKAR